MTTGAAVTYTNGNLPLGNIPGWDNHNHAGFADAGLGTSDVCLRDCCFITGMCMRFVPNGRTTNTTAK